MGTGIFLESCREHGLRKKGMGKQYIPSRTRASGKLCLVLFLSLLLYLPSFLFFLGAYPFGFGIVQQKYPLVENS